MRAYQYLVCSDAYLYSRCCLLGDSIFGIQVIHLHCMASCQALVWVHQLCWSEALVSSLGFYKECEW